VPYPGGPLNPAQQLVCELCLMLNKRKPAVLVTYYELEGAEKILGFFATKFRRKPFTYRITEFTMQDRDNPDAWRIRCYIISLQPPLKIGEELIDEELGAVLGYPKCCAQQYARDKGFFRAFLRYLAQVAKQRPISPDPFRLSLYRGRVKEGYYHLVSGAKISHIPCSPRCQASRRLAKKIRSFCSGKLKRRECCLAGLRRNWPSLCLLRRSV